MTIAERMLPEFDNEMPNTRKLLDRLPDTITDWKPHEKSMRFDRLACHVAELPGWIVETINRDSLDIMSMPFKPEDFLVHSRKDALEKFDLNVKKGRAALAGASDEQMLQNWSLLRGGQTMFTLPRVAVLRTMVMNHLIHHRAQLGVYMRLNNIAIPGLYGPSADDPV